MHTYVITEDAIHKIGLVSELDVIITMLHVLMALPVPPGTVRGPRCRRVGDLCLCYLSACLDIRFRLMAHIRLAPLDQLDREVVQLVEVVGCEGDGVWAPAEPVHVLTQRLDVLARFSLGVRVVVPEDGLTLLRRHTELLKCKLQSGASGEHTKHKHLKMKGHARSLCYSRHRYHIFDACTI